MKIGLDIHGGDFAPENILKGATISLEILKDSNDKLVLFGKEEQVRNFFENKGFGNVPDSIEIVNCSQVIEMGDDPVKSFKEKENSSIFLGLKFLKQGYIDSFASAGNTGAMLVGVSKIIETLPGIVRPCIASFVPNDKGSNNLLLDVGINSDPKPKHLLQYAILADIFAKNIMGISNPKIGLLNIGEEKSKGNILAKSAYYLLDNHKKINFIGNIEGGDIFNSDVVDVIVTDGFTGNVVLKMAESFYDIIKKRNISDNYFNNFNYENYGGTPILGINKPIIVGHGKSTPIAIKNMISLSLKIIKSGIIDIVSKELNHDKN